MPACLCVRMCTAKCASGDVGEGACACVQCARMCTSHCDAVRVRLTVCARARALVL